MSRRRGVMSESLKYELAKDLGFYDVVQREGWSGIRTKDAGNMVKRAIQIAQEHLVQQQHGSSMPTAGGYGGSAGAGGYHGAAPGMRGQAQMPYAAAGQPRGYTQTTMSAPQQGSYSAASARPSYGQPPMQGSTYS